MGFEFAVPMALTTPFMDALGHPPHECQPVGLALRFRLGLALRRFMPGINDGCGHLFLLGKQVAQAGLVGRERRGPVELVHGLVQSLMRLAQLGRHGQRVVQRFVRIQLGTGTDSAWVNKLAGARPWSSARMGAAAQQDGEEGRILLGQQ